MQELWKRSEMLSVLAFYASHETPKKYTKIELQKLSSLLNSRSLSSLKLRLANFAARDVEMQALGLKGMTGGGDHVDLIWDQCSDINGKLDNKKLLRELAYELASVRNRKV